MAAAVAARNAETAFALLRVHCVPGAGEGQPGVTLDVAVTQLPFTIGRADAAEQRALDGVLGAAWDAALTAGRGKLALSKARGRKNVSRCAAQVQWRDGAFEVAAGAGDSVALLVDGA